MKYILLGMGVVSAVATAGILLVPQSQLASAPVQRYKDQRNVVAADIDLNKYFSDKGIAPQLAIARAHGANIDDQPSVLGDMTSSPSASPQLQPETVYDATEVAAIEKSNLTVAVLGDSMVDTLGPKVAHLVDLLKNHYPDKTITAYNYGAGATNIEQGIDRLNNDFNYLGNRKPPLLSLDPDIIVVESFAYNHWENSQSDLDRHWLSIAKIIDKIKSHNPNTRIILAAAIAPNCKTYTDGSANLPPDRKFRQCETVKKYLQNIINFAHGEKLPIADAYHPSLGKDGNGDEKYINQGDHIHPSEDGKKLFAQKVAEQIYRLVK